MDQIDDPAERSHATAIDTGGPKFAAENSPAVSAGWAWLAGTLGAAVALGVGEFASRLSEQVMSLVIGVGEVFVDITPVRSSQRVSTTSVPPRSQSSSGRSSSARCSSGARSGFLTGEINV